MTMSRFIAFYCLQKNYNFIIILRKMVTTRGDSHVEKWPPVWNFTWTTGFTMVKDTFLHQDHSNRFNMNRVMEKRVLVAAILED